MKDALRVVGGALSGRRFGGRVPEGTRPTADRVREAIASAIESRGGFEGARVLDLFSGTGAMAIEALSRGASHAVLVESHARARAGIAASLKTLGLTARTEVLGVDLREPRRLVEALRASAPFDRVLADPPYRELALVRPLWEALREAGLVADGALLVLEHGAKDAPEVPPWLEELVRRRYGDSAVLIARYAPRAPGPASGPAPTSEEAEPR